MQCICIRMCLHHIILWGFCWKNTSNALCKKIEAREHSSQHIQTHIDIDYRMVKVEDKI